MSDEGYLLHEADVPRIFRAVRQVEDGLLLPPAPRRRVLSEADDRPCLNSWIVFVMGGPATAGTFLLTFHLKDGAAPNLTVDLNSHGASVLVAAQSNADLYRDSEVIFEAGGGPLDGYGLTIAARDVTNPVERLEWSGSTLDAGTPYILQMKPA